MISNLTYNSCFIQHEFIPGVYERPRFVISRRVLLSASVTRLIPEKLRSDIKEQVGASHSSSTMVLYLKEAMGTYLRLRSQWECGGHCYTKEIHKWQQGIYHSNWLNVIATSYTDGYGFQKDNREYSCYKRWWATSEQIQSGACEVWSRVYCFNKGQFWAN